MKFHQGEIALVAVQPTTYRGLSVGDSVEIVSLPGDSMCRCCGRARAHSDGYAIALPTPYLGWSCASMPERGLRKRPQPGIPEIITRIFEEPVSA